MTIKISKSAYMQGLKCPVSLWHKWYSKSIASDFNNASKSLFSQGYEIGRLAKTYFGSGKEVKARALDKQACLAETKAYVKNGENIIFEAMAMHPGDGSYAHADILKKVPGTDQWDLIEVKSGTGVKDDYIDDLAFQYYVFTGAGYKIRNACIMHVDNSYVRQKDLDVHKLLSLKNITAAVLQKQDDVVENIKKIKGYLSDRKNPPSEKNELLCKDPYRCNYKHGGHNWPLHSIFNIYSKRDHARIYKTIGSAKIEDIPKALLPTNKKLVDIESYRSGKEHVDRKGLQAFLGKIRYPLYYLDYETMMNAVPLFKNTRPYQQIPFQFSLHVQDKKNGALVHHEFLHQNRSDSRRAFAKALIAACGTKGSVIVYNQVFEAQRNKELADEFPQYAKALHAINDRMVDLYEPFRDRLLYHPDQKGSASIKAVLPAFTSLSYDNMEIGDGLAAMDAYSAFVRKSKAALKPKQLFSALSKYCKMDTYAMVELLRVMRQKAAGSSPSSALGHGARPVKG